jgi:glutamate 5-kinase
VIASGRETDVLIRLANNEAIGTHLFAEQSPISKRKSWLAGHVRTNGMLTVDAGAARVLRDEGRSLLPIGVLAVTGEFGRGEVVTVVDETGKILARGIANYSAADTQKILRKPSSQIESILGYVDEPELIHRDHLVVV